MAATDTIGKVRGAACVIVEDMLLLEQAQYKGDNVCEQERAKANVQGHSLRAVVLCQRLVEVMQVT